MACTVSPRTLEIARKSRAREDPSSVELAFGMETVFAAGKRLPLLTDERFPLNVHHLVLILNLIFCYQ
jgi:hypothetical protein